MVTAKSKKVVKKATPVKVVKKTTKTATPAKAVKKPATQGKAVKVVKNVVKKPATQGTAVKVVKKTTKSVVKPSKKIVKEPEIDVMPREEKELVDAFIIDLELQGNTSYEKARMIGSRALQLSQGAKPQINLTKKQLEEIRYDPLEIAKKEYEAKKIPLSIRRVLPHER